MFRTNGSLQDKTPTHSNQVTISVTYFFPFPGCCEAKKRSCISEGLPIVLVAAKPCLQLSKPGSY